MRMRMLVVALGLILVACNDSRVAKLEAQNKQLSAEVASVKAHASLENQAKCSKDAREFFTREWSPDSNTKFLDYRSHYSPQLSRCFITIHWNYALGPQSSSIQKITNIYDVYEHTTVAEYSELDTVIQDGIRPVLGMCEVQTIQCTSFDDFSRRIAALE